MLHQGSSLIVVNSCESSPVGQSFYAIFGSNPPQIAILMKHALFNVKFNGDDILKIEENRSIGTFPNFAIVKRRF